MNFFQTSDGQDVEKTDSFDAGGGAFEPIPEGTQVVAMASEAKWDSYQGENYINMKWEVIDGEYKNRILFQKIKVEESDSKKRDKAIKMLGAIDSIFGGVLMTAGERPTDMSLAQNLCNKPIALKLGVWEIDGKSGNWVQAVSSIGKAKAEQTQVKNDNSFDEDVPF